MNRTRFEGILYNLSVRLNTEIYVVGVGPHVFLPHQSGSAGFVETRHTGVAEWVMACLDNPQKLPWWTHTHPRMRAFVSFTDVEGAHALWSAVLKPFRLAVLGEDSRHEEIVDKAWIAQHPVFHWERFLRKRHKRHRKALDWWDVEEEIPLRRGAITPYFRLEENPSDFDVRDAWEMAHLLLGPGEKLRPED